VDIYQSRNRGWGKEGEGGELRTGDGGGVGDIGGTSRVYVGWETRRDRRCVGGLQSLGSII